MSVIQRSFIPGSQCVYIKFYTGEKTADNLLIKVVSPVIKKLQKEKQIEKWFFIRFSDPDFHLRIRLFTANPQYTGEIIQQFYQKLNVWNKDRLLWKVQLDTYNRELERYNQHLIEEAESVFCADSECILSIIKRLNGNENYRWMIGLKLINELLSDFGLNIEEKQKLMEDAGKSYKTEFGFNEHNSKQFNTKFRENKKTVESVLSNEFNEKEFISLFSPIKNAQNS
jgi:thiopeptide-type bacteriocin biosynthesis protein